MELRPYQVEAVQAVRHEWDHGASRTLLVLPTGTGKTIVFCEIVSGEVRKGRRVLILAHREELLEQAADKLEKATGLKCSVEKARKSGLGSWYRVTVGSVQTMCRKKRLDLFPPDYFTTIIVDEAHHVLSDSYQRVLKHFPAARVLGVTATPDRGDMRNLSTYFDSLAYEYRLDKAIRDGWLCPITIKTINVSLDLRNVKITHGDYDVEALDSTLAPYLERIADIMTDTVKGRHTVVFLPLIRTAAQFAYMLRQRGFRAVEINGDSPDRRQVLADFNAGQYDVLCNAMLLTEGWDCPSVNCVIVLRPTRVRSLFVQMVGRGTRTAPGKTDLLLLDFIWLTEKHSLCHPACLICKDEETAGRMTENLMDGNVADLSAAAEQAERDVKAERERNLAKKLENPLEDIKPEGSEGPDTTRDYEEEQKQDRSKKLMSASQYALYVHNDVLVNYQPMFKWERKPPTERQLAALERSGIGRAEVRSLGMASYILDSLAERREAGLTTPKQIRCLEAKGFQHVSDWTFQDARRLIDVVSENGWRVPLWLDPATYVPRKETEHGQPDTD